MRKQDITLKILNDNANDPDQFWNAIKRVYPSNAKRSETRSFKIDGSDTTNPNKIAENFCSYFSSIVSIIKQKACTFQNLIWRKPANVQIIFIQASDRYRSTS